MIACPPLMVDYGEFVRYFWSYFQGQLWQQFELKLEGYVILEPVVALVSILTLIYTTYNCRTVRFYTNYLSKDVRSLH